MKIVTALLCLAAAWPLGAQQDPKDTGPTALVIQYRCFPNQRLQLRSFMHDQGVRQLAQWKSNALIADYRVLFSRYVDTDTWDMMLILSFRDYDSVAKWRLIEHRSAAALPESALAWTTAVNTYPADLLRSKATDSTPKQPVYMVIPYAVSAGTPEYLQYFDGYVAPQCDGWMKEGILGRAELYMQRYTASRPWDSLLILQYNDDESLGARERTAAKVSEQLRENPAWRALGDNEQNIRIEKQPVIADEIAITR